MSDLIRWPLLVACLLGLVHAASADGGMFPQFARSAESADQRAIVVFDEGRETLILQTAYQGDAADFAWVIPIPTLMTSGDIATVDPGIFDDLYYLTEPAAYGHGGYRAQGLLGCSSGSDGEQQFASVRVWDSLQVDDYQITILSAGESSDLQAWLNANGYSFPAEHQGELAYYVAKSWFFVAAKINPAATRDGNTGPVGPPGGGDFGGGSQGEEMRPLRLRFAADEPVYPMRISAASTPSEVEVLLYVIARHRIAAANYNTEDVTLTSHFEGGDFGAYYEEQFRDSLARAGAGSLLVEYAGPLHDWIADRHRADLGLGDGSLYVTRLRTYLEPQHMAEDVVMAQAAADDDLAIRVALAPESTATPRLAAVGLLFALATMLGLTSRDRCLLVRALLIAAVIALLII